MKDAAIIISGGMDSTTMLYEYKDEIVRRDALSALGHQTHHRPAGIHAPLLQECPADDRQ